MKTLYLEKSVPARNCLRYYRLEAAPDLFGQWILRRSWGLCSFMSLSTSSPSPASLFDHSGRRKYLTGEERRRFLAAASRADRHIRTLCMTLTFTGCRISEALALTPGWTAA